MASLETIAHASNLLVPIFSFHLGKPFIFQLLSGISCLGDLI